MRWDASEDKFVLASGKRFYAHARLLSVRDDDRSLFYGYDGCADYVVCGDDSNFTPEERREIAEYVIERWRKWLDPAWKPIETIDLNAIARCPKCSGIAQFITPHVSAAGLSWAFGATLTCVNRHTWDWTATT